MNRQHVNLSQNIATATAVGSRGGVPVVLELNAHQMRRDAVSADGR